MNRLTLLLSIIVAAGCYFFGAKIAISVQLPIYESLRNTSAIIFGVMGAWIAILYPNSLLKIYGKVEISESEKEYKSIKQLISPMVLSTIIVSLVLVVGLIAPIMRNIHFFVIHKEVVRSFSFSLLGLLTFLQLWALVATLAPSDMIQRTVDFTIKKRKIVKQKFPNITQ